jgi:hypothetical protein
MRTQEHISALRTACHAGEQTLAMNAVCAELEDSYEHYEAELAFGETDEGAEMCAQIAYHLGEIDRCLALFVLLARLQALMPGFCLAFDRRTCPAAH